MNPFVQALSAGFNPSQILRYISQLSPQLQSQINQARSAGYPVEKIVDYLYRGGKKINSELPEAPKEYGDIYSQAVKGVHKGTPRMAKVGLHAAALAAGAYGLYQASRPLVGQVLPALQGQFGGGQPPQNPGQPQLPGPQGGGTPPNQPNPTPPIQPQSPQMPQNAPVQNQVQQPQPQLQNPNAPISNQPLQSIVTPISTKTQLEMIPGFTKKIADLVGSGNNAEQIAGFLQFNDPKNAKLLEKQAGKPLQEVITEYLPNVQQQAQPSNLMPQPIEKPQIQSEKQNIKESPLKKRNVFISPGGMIEHEHEKIDFGKAKGYKPLGKITYEEKYENLNPKQKKSYEIIDRAIAKTADHIVKGKDFKDLLPKTDKSITLSTAEDVLRSLIGAPSKYNLMSAEEQEETFNTFQGLSPNIIWNTISLIDPEIQKISRPISPKGKKAGKEEMTPNDFRRFLAHSVNNLIEKKERFGENAKMIINVIDKLERDRNKNNFNVQELSDEELNKLFEAVNEIDIKKLR